jgi:putative Mg2+ transporter-C (MgtC) family protein
MSDGRGIMRDVLAECTNRGFAIGRVSTDHLGSPSAGQAATIAATLEVEGRGSVNDLTGALDDLDRVFEVTTSDTNEGSD